MPTNKQIIQGAYQAFAEGDVPKVLAVMDDKIEWTGRQKDSRCTALT
jgi:ketosteroid isomerase-like protein